MHFSILNKSSRSCCLLGALQTRHAVAVVLVSFTDELVRRSILSWSERPGQINPADWQSSSGRSQARVSLMILATLDMGMGVRAPVVYVLLIWPTSLCAETEICPRFGYFFFFFPSSGVTPDHAPPTVIIFALIISGGEEKLLKGDASTRPPPYLTRQVHSSAFARRKR